MGEPITIVVNAETQKAVQNLEQVPATLNQIATALKQTSAVAAPATKALQEVANNVGNNRIALMELGHVGRAMAEGLAAGISPVRMLAMEAPRLAQAALTSGINLKGVAIAIADIIPLAATAAFGLAAVHSVLSRPLPMEAFLVKENDELKKQADLLKMLNELRTAGLITEQQYYKFATQPSASVAMVEMMKAGLVVPSKGGGELKATSQALIAINKILQEINQTTDEGGKKIQAVSDRFQELKEVASAAGLILMRDGAMTKNDYDALLQTISTAGQTASDRLAGSLNFENMERNRQAASEATAKSQQFFAEIVRKENDQLERDLSSSAAKQAKTREQIYQEEFEKRMDLLTRQLYAGEIEQKEYDAAVQDATTKRIEGLNQEREATARLYLERLRVAQQDIQEKSSAILSDTGTDNLGKANALANLSAETQGLISQNAIKLAGVQTDRERVSLQKEQNGLIAQYNQLMRQQQQLAPTLSQAMRSGIVELKNEWGSLALQVKAGFIDIYHTMTTSISSALTGLIERTKTWGEALNEIGTSILNGIISAIVKMFVTWVVNMVVLRALQAVFGKETNQEASESAAAWGPAAVAASIASYGAAAAVGTAAAIAGMALGAIAGAGLSSYDVGGYTGNGGRLEAAGIVHRGEFVMDADKTQRFRPLLEAMHQGRDLPNNSARSNNGLGKTHFQILFMDDRQRVEKAVRDNPDIHNIIVDVVKRRSHYIAPIR